MEIWQFSVLSVSVGKMQDNRKRKNKSTFANKQIFDSSSWCSRFCSGTIIFDPDFNEPIIAFSDALKS